MANGHDKLDPLSGTVRHEGHAVGWSLGAETDETRGGSYEIHYHFPVEIEVRNTALVDEDRIIHAALERLARELSA
jgi:hypothetical protein